MTSSNTPKQLLIKIKATHFNYVNKNHLLYTENAVTRGAKSWTTPFNKPQLIGHDTKSAPIGRILDYKIVKGETKKGIPGNYVELIAKISDPDSIEKILDGRYSTVSVGSSSCRVICSECDQIITEDGLCEHKKGSYNEKGNPIYWLIDQIGYTEDSFVNEPADEYAIIDEIQINSEWVSFLKFSDNREPYIFTTEDSMSTKDTQLSSEQREQFPLTTFCGPNRSFPSHDKVHVIAGLALLDTLDASDDSKAKIRADLYRKGKVFGIEPAADAVEKDFDILYRIDDDFSADEIAELDSWFADNVNSDLPKIENTDETETPAASKTEDAPQEKEVSKMKRAELIDEVSRVTKLNEDSKEESDNAINVRDSKILELEDKVKSAETITYEKEDTLNKYVDKVCILEKKYRDSIISNIIDLKMADNTNEERQELESNFNGRTLDSLEDSLNDLRIGKFEQPINTEDRVEDPTQDIEKQQTQSDSQDDSDSEGSNDPRFAVFSVDRRNMEADK